MLNDQQVQAYLERLGYDGSPRANRETLDSLIYLNQSTIPFETVTLHRGGALPSLDVDDIYQKVVVERFGGYCFELNKLFEALLQGIGFDVRPVLCRAVRGRDNLMPINHRGMIVNLEEGPASADVGFGGPMPSGALLLAHATEQNINGETYISHRHDDAWWHVDRVTQSTKDLYDDHLPERRQTELALCTAKVEELDFDSLNQVFSAPGTLFRDHEIVNLRTEGGYYGLKDGVLTKRVNGTKEIVELANPEDVDQVLADVFGMVNIKDWPKAE